ncbi:glucose-6-phosphate dehydrogenase [Rhodococcus sp. D2-41]|uniref:Glucose-6-phosphate 1-dehydrogenase n=1 Tax=Speluncibacter jeojiensis TaxID=2710754 RepID=A0A9X4LYU8_9ACTN|nr:glucose-6-phosphate dehydrogenase [Rhodococcus sp. D2-41]MDG3010925.1 glucose-6-phosphate dehydrogenase [Rhodococcus sp. D2-41]MDG3013900.1 glucose-6-phosphate dehydrogenase [Corynebacteriales bacterium D3-21]
MAGEAPEADVLVIFGITGDLARKMTYRALYRLEQHGLLRCEIVGVAADDIGLDDLVSRARESIAESGTTVDDEVFTRLAGRLDYLSGDVTEHEVYRQLASRIHRYQRPLFYLEMPPSLFAPIVEQLGKADLLTGATVAVEKPFGHDLDSARDLNARLHDVLDESQILRVDHFLGKEPVIELEYLRFANLALAEIWDRHTVSSIQITMAEDFGVTDRGSFYDKVGALRDVVQNHLMQVLALVAMEPPAGDTADELRDKKCEVFRAMPALDPAHCVRGQYEGYLDVDGVEAGSTTETFVAMRLEIDNWRWSGVPIFLRAGKGLPERVTEVRLLLRRTPKLAFLRKSTQVDANQIVLRIDPDPGMRMHLTAMGKQTWQNVHLQTLFAGELGEPLEPYERLLHSAMSGDHSLFARQDAVEETWRIVQPLLDNPPPVHTYPTGSWGPDEADSVVRGHAHWQEPWLGE